LNRPALRRRSGYVSLLAVSFAFGLATLGTAVAVSVRAYISASTGQEREILDRIALEAGAFETLGHLAAGASVPATQARTVNGRTVTLALSLPGTKLDLRADPAVILAEALEQVSVIAKGGELPVPRPSDLAAFSQAMGLNADGEDCLRQEFTYGRAPAVLSSEPKTDDQILVSSAGEQIDVRAQLDRGALQKVLWLRARFSGGESGWALHDYRQLQGRFGCPAVLTHFETPSG
tara:strand:+ start:27024 stop:27725 length:702 start_codon:yes stop_codon:yes gene_type:complete